MVKKHDRIAAGMVLSRCVQLSIPPMIAREARLFFTAWMFFTRVPLPAGLVAWVGYSPELLNASARYFPSVGILVGAVGALILLAGIWLFTPLVAVALSMTATILMTGAFHEDGLADSVDGFGGSHLRERVLEIMKDSRIGTFGAVALVCVLLIKFSALVSIVESGQAELAAAVLIAGHALSRAAASTLIRLLPYARAEDPSAKAKPLAESISVAGLAFAWVVAVLPLATIAWMFDGGWVGWLGLLPVALAAWGAGTYFMHRIGGYTGDCLGAAQQLTEVAFLLFVVAVSQGTT